MFVEQIMTTPAVTVGPEEQVAYAAAALMQAGGFRHLPGRADSDSWLGWSPRARLFASLGP